MERKPTLLLADDHSILLEGVRRILETDYEVIGAANNGREVVDAAESMRPDLVVLDIGMPILNGIDACRRIRECSPGTKVAFLTQHTDTAYVREAFRAGALGYVLKQSAAGELRLALRSVLEDRFYISKAVAERIPEIAFHEIANPGGDPIGRLGRPLTPRQREVLQLVAEGKSAKEIAVILSISVKTVEFHKAAIMDEVGLRTTAELTRYALAHGLVQA